MKRRGQARANLARLWDRYDRGIAYIFIVGFAVLELLVLIFPPAEGVIAPEARLVLLCLGLLAFFRSIDANLRSMTARMHSSTLSEALRRVEAQRMKDSELSIAANDGVKYYSFLSDGGAQIATLRLLISDPTLLQSWRGLAERGIVLNLEVRLRSEPPPYHLLIVRDRVALFGAFRPRQTGFAAGTTITADDSNREQRDLIAVYQALFDIAWDEATVLYPLNPSGSAAS
ncbi:MAG: hypothetical protein JWQ39_2608 [Glaciihabitans sp.]|jgi:hypothetical protein|nr:hypothetical protein [Glaciihabitans sp.]